LEKEFPERVDGRLMRKAIINVLIIGIGFKPEFVCVAKEDQAEEKKGEDKSERRLGEGHFV
jgi:hypothetical protein